MLNTQSVYNTGRNLKPTKPFEKTLEQLIESLGDSSKGLPTISDHSEQNKSTLGNSFEEYKKYVKPAPSSLLQFLNMNVEFTGGLGDELSYRDESGKDVRILDATGGYGANILGHNNIYLKNALVTALNQGAPSMVQGSIRTKSAKLANLISDLLSKEVGKGHWISNFSNSGTEAVEAALKHAQLYHSHQMRTIAQDVRENINVVKMALDKVSPKLKVQLLDIFNKKFSLKDKICSIDQALDYIYKLNMSVIEKEPFYLAVEGAFHGKTSGSLGLTYNQQFKESFYVRDNTIYIQRDDIELKNLDLTPAQEKIFLLDLQNFQIIETEILKIAASIVEPIQGEAGIYELDKDMLVALRKLADDSNFLLVFDEIQAGVYRTGKLASGSHKGVMADTYCFSKSLGGGIAKIGATVTYNSKYIPEFSMIHTSTFAEDDLSSSVALEVLNRLQDESLVEKGLKVGEFIKKELIDLKKKFPNVIKEIRGTGLMLAIEFNETLMSTCYEYKFCADSGFFGYFLSSALFNNEKIRIAPTLSNPYTLRVEPSMKFSFFQAQKLIRALERISIALRDYDINYLLKHVFPGMECKKIASVKREINYEANEVETAVFLNHLIHTSDAKKLIPAVEHVSDQDLEKEWISMFEFLRFEIYDRFVVQGDNGKKIEVIMMSLPISSKIMFEIARSKEGYLLVDKIQKAIEYAKTLNATTVGLGQFTSIVTRNGMRLDPMGMNLTTGNSLTTSLGVEALKRAAKNRNVDIKDSSVGCIGAAGNIVSVASSILADECSKLMLVYHTQLKDSQKMASALSEILENICRSKADSKVVLTLKKLLNLHKPKSFDGLVEFMDRVDVKEVIEVVTDLERVKECDLVFSGTNSRKGIISEEHLKKNAIVLDVGVPSAIQESLYEKRPDVYVVLGGIAELPDNDVETPYCQAPAFPLGLKEAFACMAETFTLSLAEEKGALNVGNLTKDKVLEVGRKAVEVGIRLGRDKTTQSL